MPEATRSLRKRYLRSDECFYQQRKSKLRYIYLITISARYSQLKLVVIIILLLKISICVNHTHAAPFSIPSNVLQLLPHSFKNIASSSTVLRHVVLGQRTPGMVGFIVWHKPESSCHPSSVFDLSTGSVNHFLCTTLKNSLPCK